MKIETLKPNSKNQTLVKMIQKSGVSYADIAQCVGMSESWLLTLVKRRNLNKHDSDVVKKVVRALSQGDKK